MALSIADYLLQLPENMNFAKVQELSGEGSLYYRMLSDYGSGSFQLIRFENDLLMILIADYTPKETFEKIATISEEYMEELLTTNGKKLLQNERIEPEEIIPIKKSIFKKYQ